MNQGCIKLTKGPESRTGPYQLQVKCPTATPPHNMQIVAKQVIRPDGEMTLVSERKVQISQCIHIMSGHVETSCQTVHSTPAQHAVYISLRSTAKIMLYISHNILTEILQLPIKINSRNLEVMIQPETADASFGAG